VSDRKEPQDERDGFLSRWSRRKSEVRQGQLAPEVQSSTRAAPAAQPPFAETAPSQPAEAVPAVPAAPTRDDPAKPEKPQLTLADVEKLTAQSDYSAFAARDVDPAVRNAAMKKLFHADPHFNVMDGLDVYIDDYNTPDPLPKAIMRTMLQARALGLLDDELKDQDKPEPDASPSTLAQAHTPSPHEDPDLQLQPDDAAGHESPGKGAVSDGDPPAIDTPGEPSRTASDPGP
jgi:Protein of unknown function (DUF3306)